MSPREAIAGDMSVVSAENPWPGLLSFREADQRWFQGRREETAELLQHVKRERLTVLFALSGIGKSSLLQAGLFPALRRDDIFPVYIRLDYAAQSPDLIVQVLDAIIQAGAAAEIRVPLPWAGASLWEYFHHIETEFWSQQQRRVLPLLIFDQFEEIFTLGRSQDRVHASEDFLDELAGLVDGSPPQAVLDRWMDNPAEKDDYSEDGEYKLLISLREDFLPELYDQHRRIASVPQKRYRLRQMNGDGALLAVSQAKDLIDESVAGQIVRYVAAGDRLGRGRASALKDLDVEPALLSVVCRELNNRRRERGERRISADLLEGSHEQVLQDFYTRGLAGIPASVQTFVEEKLITVGGARNSVALDDALAVPGMSTEMIEQLVERRLLRREFRRDEVRLELTHDLLTGVVRSSRDIRRNQETLEKQQRERQEAEAKLRRSRTLTWAFAAIAVVVFGLLVLAVQQTAVARRETVEKGKQATLAKQQKALADERLAQYLSELTVSEKQTLLAREAARRTEEEKKRADQNAADEKRARRESDLNAARAKQEALAKQQESQAKDKALEEKQKALEDGERKRQEAVTAGKKADDAKRAEEEKGKELAISKAQNEKELAKSIVAEAITFASNRKFDSAMAKVARALTLDRTSLPARSLALDLLLRGGLGVAANPNQPGARQFIHPPLTHPDGVLFAVFSPDGSHIATTSRDNKVRVWDWQAGTSVEVGTHQLAATAAFSPDGHYLVTAGRDGAARVWDLSTRALAHELKHGSLPVSSAMFSPDGRRIVTASQDKTVQLWDAATGTKAGAPLQHPSSVNFASFSPDSSGIATASGNRMRVWNLASPGAPVFEIQQAGDVKSSIYSSDTKRLVTASSDRAARIWDVGAQAPAADPMQHSASVFFATFSPRGDRVVTASDDGTARIWEAASGRPVTSPLVHKKRVLSAVFSPDGRRVVTASDDNTAEVWEVWYDFENIEDLVKLLEGLSGSDASQESLPQLSDGGKSRLAEVKAKTNLQPATSFLRWFFAHRQ
jgi:Tol biopolymer transport system component